MPPSGSRRAALRAQQSRNVEHLTAANGIIKTSDHMCRRSNPLLKGTSQMRERSLLGMPLPPRQGGLFVHDQENRRW